MTEAILIEIEQRFARLESAIEDADLLLAAWQNPGELGPDERVPVEEFENTRADLAAAVEHARGDLRTMLEFIRKVQP